MDKQYKITTEGELYVEVDNFPAIGSAAEIVKCFEPTVYDLNACSKEQLEQWHKEYGTPMCGEYWGDELPLNVRIEMLLADGFIEEI